MILRMDDHVLRPIWGQGRVRPARPRGRTPARATRAAPTPGCVLRPLRAARPSRGLAVHDEVLVLTWLDRADRATLVTRPRNEPDRWWSGVVPPGRLTARTSSACTGSGAGRRRTPGPRVGPGSRRRHPLLDVKPVLGPTAEALRHDGDDGRRRRTSSTPSVRRLARRGRRTRPRRRAVRRVLGVLRRRRSSSSSNPTSTPPSPPSRRPCCVFQLPVGPRASGSWATTSAAPARCSSMSDVPSTNIGPGALPGLRLPGLRRRRRRTARSTASSNRVRRWRFSHATADDRAAPRCRPGRAAAAGRRRPPHRDRRHRQSATRRAPMKLTPRYDEPVIRLRPAGRGPGAVPRPAGPLRRRPRRPDARAVGRRPAGARVDGPRRASATSPAPTGYWHLVHQQRPGRQPHPLPRGLRPQGDAGGHGRRRPGHRARTTSSPSWQASDRALVDLVAGPRRRGLVDPRRGPARPPAHRPRRPPRPVGRVGARARHAPAAGPQPRRRHPTRCSPASATPPPSARP